MLGLFNNKPLLDENATRWLFDAYGWALSHFGSDLFYQDTILVTPTNKHFPGNADSVEALAALLFERVKGYANMQTWPLELIALTPESEPAAPAITRESSAPRGPAAAFSLEGAGNALPVIYSPEQVRDPGVTAAVFSHQLAGYLSRTAETPPPGGDEHHGFALDLLSIFLGFGLFMANNAVRIGSGCGGCGKSVQSLGYLSEDEMTYALAIFSVLKEIPDSEVTPHLKSALRPLYKRAVKEVRKNGPELEKLRAIQRPVK